MQTEVVPFEHPWQETNLGSVSVVEVGGTPSTTIPAFWTDGDIPWMSSGDVHQRRIIDVPGRITKLGLQHSNTKLIQPPAVAIALAGQGKTRGTVALTLLPLCTNQSVALVKGQDGILDTAYLFHALNARYEELRARSAGGGRAGLSKGIIEAIPIPLPPFQEQLRIVEILDTLDETIAHTTSIIAKLKQIKAGLLHDLLTRGLDENGELRDAIAHPEKFKDSPLGQIPKEWEVFQLSEVVPRAEYGISVSLEDEVGIPVLRMNNLKNGEVDLTDLKKSGSTQAAKLLLQDFDVLFNRTNSIEHVGRTSIWRGLISQASFALYLVRLVPDTSKIIHEYLNIWLNLPSTQLLIRRYATPGVHQVNINPTNLRKVLIALPNKVSEQKQIVERITVIDNRIRNEEAYCDKLKQQKKGLMYDLLTGRVRVSNFQKISA